jgi:hypothetical protein
LVDAHCVTITKLVKADLPSFNKTDNQLYKITQQYMLCYILSDYHYIRGGNSNLKHHETVKHTLLIKVF